MTGNLFHWSQCRQLSVLRMLLAFIVPSCVAFGVFHGILPVLVSKGMPAIVAWPLVASGALLMFVLFALSMLVVESKQLGIRLRERLCLKTVTLKNWGWTIFFTVTVMLVSAPLSKLTVLLMETIHFSVPAYMPFFLNPAVNPMTTPPEALTPNFVLKGQYWIVALFMVTLLLNILTEDLYFRAWLLPKMSRFGWKSWILNGFLFASYHTFQLWLFPMLLVPTCVMAYLTYKTRSILPSFAVHFVLNFALAGVGIMLLVSR